MTRRARYGVGLGVGDPTHMTKAELDAFVRQRAAEQGLAVPTKGELVADIRARAASDARASGHPEAAAAIEASGDSSIQESIAAGAAVGSGAAAYAACMAPFVTAAVASGGAAAAAPAYAHFICGAAGSVAASAAAWLVMNVDDAYRWVVGLFTDEPDRRPWKEKYPPPAGWPDAEAVAYGKVLFESGRAEAAFSRSLPSPFLTIDLPNGGRVIWQGAGPGQITSGYAPVLNVPHGTTMAYLLQRLSPTHGRVFRETWSGGVWVWIGDFQAQARAATAASSGGGGGVGIAKAATIAFLGWKLGELIAEMRR